MKNEIQTEASTAARSGTSQLDKNAIFIHNWRCAGTSLHSLLSANFHGYYLKLGDPFDRFGKSAHKPRLALKSTELNHLRRNVRTGSIVAGHIFMGLDAFLPGNWDYWMNAREPLARIKSGLLRFYSRESNPGHSNAHNLIRPSSGLTSRGSIVELLSSSIARERNGMCRRLAAMALCKEFSVTNTQSLERLDFLEEDYSEEELFMTAYQQLKRIKVLFLSDYVSASTILLEKTYGFGPLINPFRALKHNSSAVTGFTTDQLTCVEDNMDIIRDSQLADLKLWPHLCKRFQQQLKSLKVSRVEVATRDLIHARELFDEKWFSGERDINEVTTLMVESIINRIKLQPKLGPCLVATILSWRVLSADARKQLNEKLQSKINGGVGI